MVSILRVPFSVPTTAFQLRTANVTAEPSRARDRRSAATPPPGTTGGTLCGVQKTTVYLPDDLKAAVAREADQRGVPEAEVIRDAIAAAVRRPLPRPGVFESERPLAARADELLAGFGDR